MTILILLLSLALHLLGAWILIRHRRNVAHHRFSMGMIGSDPVMTQVLHDRMLNRQPDTDWLNPHIMRAKVAAWQRAQKGEQS